MRGPNRIARFTCAGLLLLALPVAAQVKTGEISSNVDGSVSSGYSADYGNMTGSDHGWVVGGDLNYRGSFYSPNFLAFNASLYLNQSRANSDSQSISSASGVNASANIFAGSRFPGSVSYTKAYNSEGNYDVPGLANYVTHGNNDAFAINWSENVPNLPTLMATFQMGSSQYSVYGTNDDGDSAFHSFNLNSNYRITGLNLSAFYVNGGGHSLIPELGTDEPASEASSGNSSYGFNVSGRLPLSGSASASVSKSNFSSNYQGGAISGSIDLMNAQAGIHPTRELSFSATAGYSDNLSGQLIQSIVSAGGAVAGLNSNGSSNSLDLEGVAAYQPRQNVEATAYVEYRTQLFSGLDLGETSYGATGSYSHKLLDGFFNGSVNMAANASNQTGTDSLSFATTENYSAEVFGWKANGTFGYSQNAQTQLITYMNSFYNYSGSVNRRWGSFVLGMGAGASHSGLTQQAGSDTSGQSYNASMGFSPFFTASGSYSKSSGQALATGVGLVPVPVPSPVLPSSQVSLYGGDSYSFSLSSSPVRGLVASASWSKAITDTSNSGSTSSNAEDQYNTFIQYHLRKLNFDGGFARLDQGFSGSGMPPQSISTFYIGVSRWFNFF